MYPFDAKKSRCVAGNKKKTTNTVGYLKDIIS